MNELVRQAALAYIQQGFHVIPLATSGKIPILSDWQTEALNKEHEIDTYWSELPTDTNYNIGISCGPSRLVVLDIDAKPGRDARHFYQSVIEPSIPLATLRVATPSGGIHVYLRLPPGVSLESNKDRLAPGFEILSTGRQCVAPPSRLENGSYAGTQPYNKLHIAEIPKDLLQLFASASRAAPIATTRNEQGKIAAGSRNSYLVSVAGRYRNMGYAPELIEKLVEAHNQVELIEPLAQTELKQSIFSQLTKWEGGEHVLKQEAEKERPIYYKASDLLERMFSDLNDPKKKYGIKTGCPSLDHLLGGGKRLGQITVWHAEAKTGKNTLWHWLMHDWLKRGIAIGYASQEIPPAQGPLPDLLSQELGINVYKDNLTEALKLRCQQALSEWPLYFSSVNGYFDFNAIKTWIVALKREANVEYFWFDHLHYMLSDQTSIEESARLLTQLKTLANELEIHIDLIVQPTKLNTSMSGVKQELGLDTLKGGSAIGQTVDSVITLRRVEDNIMEIRMSAIRHKLGKKGTFYLRYNPNLQTFEETAWSPPEAAPQGDYRPWANGNVRGKFSPHID